MSVTASISNISRCSVHDGPGVRTVVYFSGCALHCQWCHNPEAIAFTDELLYAQTKCIHCGRCVQICPEHHVIVGNEMVVLRDGCKTCGQCIEECPSGALTLSQKQWSVAELLKEVLKEKHYFLQNGGVTLSGGECLIQADFCTEFLRECKNEGIHTAIETALFVPWKNIEAVIPYCDFIFADFKIPDALKHKTYTGQDNDLILANLRKLTTLRKHAVTLRIPLIPGVNDSESDILGFVHQSKEIAENLRGIEVLRYNNLGKSKYLVAGKTFTDFGAPQSVEELTAFCSKLENELESKTQVYCTF